MLHVVIRLWNWVFVSILCVLIWDEDVLIVVFWWNCLLDTCTNLVICWLRSLSLIMVLFFGTFSWCWKATFILDSLDIELFYVFLLLSLLTWRFTEFSILISVASFPLLWTSLHQYLISLAICFIFVSKTSPTSFFIYIVFPFKSLFNIWT